MNTADIRPLTEISHINEDIQLLPAANLQKLIDDPRLISGYIKQSQQFIQYVESIAATLDEDSSKLLQVQTLIDKYQAISQTITRQLTQILQIYQEFINLQAIQYKLLLIFNQDYLMKKFERQLEDRAQKSHESIDYDDAELTYIARFRQERKQYHLQKEKLNRWKEERVTGFI